MEGAIMFDLLTTKSSSPVKTEQLTEFNKILKKINQYETENPEKLHTYYLKLESFYNKYMRQSQKEQTIQQWFTNHPLQDVKREIDKITNKHRILKCIEHINFHEIYRNYDSKESFRDLMQEQLSNINPNYKAISLGGGNNPIIHVTLNQDEQFILRLLRLNSKEESQGNSPKQAREKLNSMSELPQPYSLLPIENDSHETTYIECSTFYPQGNLEELFKHLHNPINKSELREDELNLKVLLYTQKCLSTLIQMNQHKIWYTDLKPSNMMLTNEGELAISDIKGLVMSEENKIDSRRTSTSQAYYQASVYEGQQINLERLQCQTLATTMYQLASNTLPEQEEKSHGQWKNNFNFDKPCFQTTRGKQIAQMIIQLEKTPTPLRDHLDKLNHFINQNEEKQRFAVRPSSTKRASNQYKNLLAEVRLKNSTSPSDASEESKSHSPTSRGSTH